MITRRELMLASLASLMPMPSIALSCTPAPDIAGAGPWFNSGPLSLAQLRGRVVLVEFWTHGCANCRNVEPYINRWHDHYGNQGLVVVGVHTPEFAYEADPKNLGNYLEAHRIAHAVVMDNDRAIWSRWHNQYWPAIYLVNKSGELCYSQFGEGQYSETERQISKLLGRD